MLRKSIEIVDRENQRLRQNFVICDFKVESFIEDLKWKNRLAFHRANETQRLFSKDSLVKRAKDVPGLAFCDALLFQTSSFCPAAGKPLEEKRK